MIKIKFCFSILFFCFYWSLSAQELDWLKNSASSDIYTNHSFYSSTYYNGDFYFAGDFWKDLIIDGLHIYIGDDSSDGFILKMDDSGTASALWHFKSDGYVRINKIVPNPVSGALIITGNFQTNLIYDSQTWDAPFYSSGFVMSIDPDGSLNWIRTFTPQNEVSFGSGGGLGIDDAGNIFVGIEAIGLLDIDDQVFEFGIESFGVIIAKFNSDGDLIMSDTWKNELFEGWMDITDIEIDENNELLISGCVIGNMVIADSTYNFSNVTFRPFLVKNDNDLNMKWLKTYVGTRCHINDVYVDGEDLILSMQYHGQVDIDGNILIGSGSWGDMAILALDEDAELKWVKNFRLSENGGNSGVYGRTITKWMDQYYIGGMYQGDVVHEDSLILDNSMIGTTYQYPFVLSLDKDGVLSSVYDFVGSNEPGRITAISSNESHLVFGGEFSGQIVLGDTMVSTINSALFYGALTNEITSIETIEQGGHQFLIYPSLVTDYLTIETDAEVAYFVLTNASGLALRKYSGDTRSIFVDELAAGVYYLLANEGDRVSYAKFIKR